MALMKVTGGCLWALLIVAFATIGVLTTGSPTAAADPNYFNSAEPGCDGSDPNVVLCDDFESGLWYSLNCDVANSSGGLLQTHGWCGTIFADPVTPLKAAVCGSKGVMGTNCAATYGTHVPGSETENSVNMADHDLAPNHTSYANLYVRYYYKADPGFHWGAMKMVTFNNCCAGVPGIKWGNFSFNCAIGEATPTAYLTMGLAAEGICQAQNVGSDITIQSGRWYYFELHINLGSVGGSDGVFEAWVNDCGTDGLQCQPPMTPTLRMRRADVAWGRTSTTDLIGTVWFENWANPVNSGTDYLDQIKVATVGPIGFMSRSGARPPNSPSGLTIR